MRVVASFYPAGDFVGLRRVGVASMSRSRDTVRGDIKGFSKKSCSRLMAKIAQLKKHALPLFLTLTYPNEYPVEAKVYKYHLHHFMIWLFRRWPGAGAIWKLEFQDRGAPHFHAFLWGMNQADYVEMAHKWYQIVGSGDKLHLAWHLGLLGGDNKPCLEVIRSWFGTKKYASKELGKIQGLQDKEAGRVWGVRGNVPFSNLIEFKIDIKTALEFRRLYRRYTGQVSRRFGFWGYGFCADWLRWIGQRSNEIEQENVPPNYPPGWWKNLDNREILHNFD
jgi:hypothetical protein